MDKESKLQGKRVKAQMLDIARSRKSLVKLRAEWCLPKVNQEFTLNGQLWRVSFVNTGQMRFTALWLGNKPNVTLDVQSSNSQSQSTIK